MHLLTGMLLGEMIVGKKLLSRIRKPAYELIHTLPGRVRFRVRSIHGDDVRARELQMLLASVRGVETVRADSRTGSVVIKFDDAPETRQSLLRALDGAVHTPKDEPKNGHGNATPLLRRQLHDLGATANAYVLEQTHGAADLRTLLAFAAGAWGVKTLFTPGAISRWQGMTLLYWSHNILRR